MRNSISLFILALFCNITFAQMESYPKGGYANLQEVFDKTPSSEFNVEIERRSKGKIKMVAGNDYQLNPIDKLVKNKFLKNELYAYSDGSILLLNCKKYEIQFWYSKIEAENDNYFVFRAGLPSNFERYGLEASNLPYMFGGIISGISAAKRALIRLPYILDKKSEEVYIVSEEDILEYIGDNKDLKEKYVNEPQKGDVDILMRYLIEWVNSSN
ncbi:DUF6563 family protein [Flagellimonas hadalis]|uniref:GLPGLI family protein n=1 Tax=Flagellimonas hadalis TaxID=2597517 RepID=A0A5N5IQU4_9FLAO|nr:DUF6563 family protein [Allomuricauda hadalis]KAB5484724.1 hypothetical protein FOT42_016165 [Allomuricauda hadalis]